MTAARARVLALAEDGLAWTRSGLAHAAGVSSLSSTGSRHQGVFETVMIPPRPVVAAPDPDYAAAGARARSEAAADMLESAVEKGGFGVRSSMASQVRARPKSISRRSPRR